MKASRLSAWNKACLRVLIQKHLRGKRDYLQHVMIKCRQLTKRYTAFAVKEAVCQICQACPDAQEDRIERVLYFTDMLDEESYLLIW